ncbi:hypothetical protein UACE39S_04768 [Ureibacillus acetophenoni]
MAINAEKLHAILDGKLKPLVKKVDEEAFYASEYLYELGKAGFFDSFHKTKEQILLDELLLVKETAKVCMTTAFCLWCHLASLTYIRQTENKALREKLLPKLENGEVLGATGLSNPMKFYADLEKLLLKAEKVDGGYIINGILPAVSNLGDNHWFGAIASLNDEQEVMVFVNTNNENIKLKEKVSFIGLNGSATYSCRFENTFVKDDFVISHNARQFADQIRPTFVLYQIPLGLGVMEASVKGIKKVSAKQKCCNSYLRVQAEDISNNIEELDQQLKIALKSMNLKEICELRLQSVYETLNATQANMLHNGSAGYIEGSVPSRILRESYFFANLTPTVRQLEKMVKHLQ